MEEIEKLIDGKLKRVYTALPAKVTSVDPENMKVKVMIFRTMSGEPLETGWIPLRSIYAGEKHGLCMIPYVDDECVIFFQDKDLNDAFVLPMSFNHESFPPPETPEGQLRIGDILLQHKSGTYVYINPDGVVEVFEKEGNRIRMTDGYIRMVSRDGQETQVQNQCNVSDSTEKVLKQWTLMKSGSEVLALEDKRVLATVSDTSVSSRTPGEDTGLLDSGNTKESAEAMETYLERASEIPYRDYHGMKYTQSDDITGGDNFFKVGLSVSGSKNPDKLTIHDGEDPEQIFEQVVHNPFGHSMAIFRGSVEKKQVSLSCLILRQIGGVPYKIGFDMWASDISGPNFEILGTGINFGGGQDGNSTRYNEELTHLAEEMKEVFSPRDYPLKKE